MPERDRFYSRGRLFFSLLVLIANVVAPFRTSAGRALIDSYGRRAPTHTVRRFQAHFQTISSHCFRAVVGVAREGSADALAATAPPMLFAIPSSPAVAGGDAPVEPALTLLWPPLRC